MTGVNTLFLPLKLIGQRAILVAETWTKDYLGIKRSRRFTAVDIVLQRELTSLTRVQRIGTVHYIKRT